MILEALAGVVQTAGLGVPGKTLFIHTIPSNVKSGIGLLMPLDGIAIDSELPGYRKGKVQAIVRHVEHALGATMANSVMDALTFLNRDLTGIHVHYCRPRHEPIVFPKSTGDLLEFSINFDICLFYR